MNSRFLYKTAPIIGKYFRQTVLAILSLVSFFSVYALISASLEDLYFSTGVFEFMVNFLLANWFVFIIAPVLFVFGVAVLWYLFDSDYKTSEDNYKNWGMAFYFLIFAVIIHLFLKSKGINLISLLMALMDQMS